MDHFTPGSALLGGSLIGLSVTLLLAGNGRVAGISGICGGIVEQRELPWRLFFVGGLAIGSIGLYAAHPAFFSGAIPRSLPALLGAGALVGLGTRLANGCTSGHGVCGMSRFAKRSIAATLTFLLAGAGTVYAVNHFLGGAL